MVIKNIMRNHYLVAFFSTLVVSLGLLIASLFIPPKGKIDPSVLAGIGEIFLWPTLAFGAKAVEKGKTAKLKKGDLEVILEEKEKEK